MPQLLPAALIPLSSAIISGVVALTAWRRRSSAPAARALTLVMLALMEWSAVELTVTFFVGADAQTAISLALFPGVALAVLGFYQLCRLMIDGDAAPSRRALLLLCVEPVIVTVLAATNGMHGWIYSDSGLAANGVLLVVRGPGFWLHAAYSYGLLGWSGLCVLRAWRTSTDLHRRQLRTILLSMLVPLLANVLNLYIGTTVTRIDLSPTAFLITGLIMWFALRRGMMRLVPVARTVVLERLSDAVVVIDPRGAVLDRNPPAVHIARLMHRDPLGDPAAGALRGLFGHGPPAGGPPPDGEYALDLGGRGLHLDVRSSRLTDRRGNLVGHAVVVRDVTELHERRSDLTAVNARLREQVAVIDRLRADLAEQAVRDVLTGLHNRRHLMAMMERELAAATAAGGPVSVVLLDIDRFKAVNDRFGHAAGDELLKATAGVLTGFARAGDTVARYGGEEFVVLLPGATMEQAWERAEQWRKRCAAVPVPGAGAAPLSFSAGVAAFPECGRSPEALLQAADDALYEAKATGRDRVLLAQPVA